MASKIIGRTKCPECGFESAHVKQSEKCHYRYCPECGSQHMAKTARQVTDLLAKTRPVDGQAAPTASGSDASASAEPLPVPVAETPPPALPVAVAPAPPPAPKRRGLF